MSHFLFWAANTLPHPFLSLISLHQNTSSNQDLHCRLELVFLQSNIRERRGWVRYQQPKMKRVTQNSGQTLWFHTGGTAWKDYSPYFHKLLHFA